MSNMKPYLRFLAPLTLLGCAHVALAQVYEYPPYTAGRPVQWFIDTGASVTTGRTSDDFDTGWTLGTGLLVRPDPTQPFALRFDLNYARSEATGSFIAANEAATGIPIDQGSLETVTGFVGPQLETALSPWLRVYATGGAGFGYQRVELTQNGFFCDAFFCGPGFGHYLVNSNDTTHFAWTAGGGMSFALPGGQSWFIEARYERIQSQGPTELVPIRVGFRF